MADRVNYYPRYPAHYLAKTLHLSMEHDGAYTRLLDWSYSNERAIPNAQRYAIARATKASEKRCVDEILSEFFTQTEGDWTNGRALHEMRIAAPRIEAARASGKKGGRPKKEKPSGFPENNPVGFQNETHKEPSAKAPQSPIPNNANSLEVIPHPEANASASAVGEIRDEVRSAILLNALGCRITPSNPDLLAAMAEGVRPEDLEAIAKLHGGKPAGYVLQIARRERAEGPRSLPQNRAGSGPAQSKTAQGLAKLEDMKNGNATGSPVVSSRDSVGPAAPALPEPRRATVG